MTQFLDDGRLQHFLTLENFPKETLQGLLERAQRFRPNALCGTDVRTRLAGKTVCNLFFENSTRTKSSFALAAQRLGADVLNFEASTSSTKKGESDIDTLKNLEAMGVDVFVIRHSENGAVAALAQHANPNTHVINAGDGRHQHPTQALLDMLSLRQAKGDDFSSLRVAIVGDILHSRVARSDIHALQTLGVGELRVCGPASLLPSDGTLDKCNVFNDVNDCLDGVDAVMMLRLQHERMAQGFINSLEDYHRDFGLNAARLKHAKPDAIVMHPGPMNRGVEISSDVADGPQSIILQQVSNGVAARMAVLDALAS